jgi:hypothetical protein
MFGMRVYQRHAQSIRRRLSLPRAVVAHLPADIVAPS